MAQIIAFPGVALASQPAARTVAKPAPTSFPAVRDIRGKRRLPKSNRPEDAETITIARLAQSFAEKAYALAQTDPDGEAHRLALHMARMADKLPCNNLRIFATPDDVLQGVWNMWRQVKIANLEWLLCDERRFDAGHIGDEATAAHWAKKQDEADAHRWLVYERLVHVPATTLSEVTSYKLDRRFKRGMGNLDWMRTHKPEIAAVIDDEIARLTVEKRDRAALRASKKGMKG